MRLLSDKESIQNLSGRISESLILVGEVVSPTSLLTESDKRPKTDTLQSHVHQMPIYPNSGVLSFSERFAISIPSDVTKQLKKYKKNVFLGVDLLLRWSKKIKQHEQFVVVGLYENSIGKIYTQQFHFMRTLVGNKLVDYEERETNIGQLSQYLSWSIDKIKEQNIQCTR